MSERRRLGVQDALWLEMDRPNNLMVVDSVIWTADPLDWDAVRNVLQERLCDRYPVFRSRALQDDDGTWWWEEDPDFSIDPLITTVELPDPLDPRSLQSLVAGHRTKMLDRDQPLWYVLFVDRYQQGSAVLVRTHHAVADGMRMVQLSMSLFDAAPDGGAILAPAVTQHAAHPQQPGQAITERVSGGLSNLSHQGTEAARAAMASGHHAIEVVTHPPDLVAGLAHLAKAAATNPVGTLHGMVSGFGETVTGIAESARSAARSMAPGSGPLIDVLSAAPGDIDSARKLLLGTRNDETIWTGTAGVEKSVTWSEPLSLDDVKVVARTNQATINDVLMTCAAGALQHYLHGHDRRTSSVTFMVPVNLKPIDLTLPEELGNSFALVQLELPTDEPDPFALLRVAKRRMNRIKHGHEAAVAFRVQETVAGMNHSIYQASVDVLANRTVGTLTNVPGPPIPVYLAGRLVEGMVGWAPVSGDQPMSFTIYSYNGQVTIGIACDSALVPDQHMIVEGFEQTFSELLVRSRVRAR